MLSQPRPVKAPAGRDFSARWNEPVDAAFPPCAYGAPADPHQYDPFGPLQEKMQERKPRLMKTSSKSTIGLPSWPRFVRGFLFSGCEGRGVEYG